MKRPEGPELKLPDLKVPPFLSDLWWDLWDRRLLPLVGVVIAAIFAAPFVLGGRADVSPPPLSAAQLAGDGPGGAGTPILTVVEAKPGLRDYRKRLARRSPSNPFKPRFTAPVLAGADLPENRTSSDSTTVTVTSGSGSEDGAEGGSAGSPAPEPAPVKPPSSGGGSGGDSGEGDSGNGSKGDLPPVKGDAQVTYYTFGINVRIVRSGGNTEESRKKAEPSVKKQVLPLTELPGEKAPVVTYMGLSKKGKALLLVSTDVRSVFGEGRCISGDDVCQLLEVEPGFPQTFVYGANEVRYTINVLKIVVVVLERTKGGLSEPSRRPMASHIAQNFSK